jgi:hypothetical protein
LVEKRNGKWKNGSKAGEGVKKVECCVWVGGERKRG